MNTDEALGYALTLVRRRHAELQNRIAPDEKSRQGLAANLADCRAAWETLEALREHIRDTVTA